MEETSSNCHGAVGLPSKLPGYQCHKKVWAFKIFNILERKEAAGYLSYVLSDGASAVVYVSKEYVEKHNPKVGGYYVRYQDGYESFSPADAFEEGYSLIDSEPKSDSNQNDIVFSDKPEDAIYIKMECVLISERKDAKTMVLLPVTTKHDENNGNYLIYKSSSFNLTLSKNELVCSSFEVGKKYLIGLRNLANEDNIQNR